MTLDSTAGRQAPAPGGPLRLRAVDADDLAVIAACLQDAILPIADMGFDADAGRFALVANRFRWEGEGNERVNAGVVIHHARAVKLKGIDRADRAQMLNLLTISYQDGAVLLTCSADCSIRIDAERLEVTLEDIGEPWPSVNRPEHPEVLP